MSKTSKITWIIVVIIAIISIGLFFNNKNSNNIIKIGVTNSLTGKYALRGEQTRNAMQMAVDEINKTGGINGKNLVLITEDNQGDPKIAVTGVNKLLDVDKVDFVLSAFTGVTNAIKDIVANHNKVMIYASTVADIAKTSPNFFMDYYKADDHGKIMADFINKQGYKRVKYLTEVSDPCKNYGNAFLSEANKLGIKIVDTETYLTTETDLKTQLLKIKTGEKFDALVLCSWQHEHIIMPEMQQLGMLNIPTFHFVAAFLAAAQTPEMTQLFSQNKSISTWYSLSDSVNGSSKQTEFVKKYSNKFGSKPTPDSAYSYDDIYILASAAKNCPSLDSTCVADELTKTNYDGVGGHISFDINRISQRESLIVQATGGLWQTVSQ